MWVAFIGGLAAGIGTGLLPGLHPNTLIFLLLPIPAAFELSTAGFIAFATAASVVHTFVSFIPTIYIGAPEADTALATLPGHRMLHDGRGREAVLLSVHGGLIGTLLAVLGLPLLFSLVPAIYHRITPLLPILLTGVLLYTIRGSASPPHALLSAGIAAILGHTVLNSPAANSQYILFPLFAGMFGISTLLVTLTQRTAPPPADRSQPVHPPNTVKGSLLGSLAGLIAGFLPGIGGAQAALLVRGRRTSIGDAIVALGALTTTDLILSLIALRVIGNPRSGAAVAIQHLTTLDDALFWQVLGFACIAAAVGALATRRLARHAAAAIRRLPYRRLLQLVIVGIVIGSAVLTGGFGLLVLGTATALGLHAQTSGARRSVLMAALIIPTALHYLPW